MKSRIHTQNFYKVSLESLIGIDSSSDNTEKSFVVSGQLSGAPTYLIIDASDISKRDIIYVHKISGNTCYYYPYNRSNPNVEHETGTYVYMNDVAEFFNYLGKNTDDFGLITKKTGLDITVYGGNIKVNGQDIQVVDTNLTVADNTTNYIVFDYIDNSIKTLTNTSGLTGIVLGEVITSGGVVDNIIDKRGYTAPIFFDGNVFEVIDGKVKIKNGVITPAAHTHTASDITNFNSAVANNSVVSANTNARHTHSNKSVLDNITNTGSGDKFLADDGTYKPTNNVHNLNDLSDVNTSGASGGQVLGYDDTNSVWKPVDQTGGSGNDLNTRKYLWFTTWSSGSKQIIQSGGSGKEQKPYAIIKNNPENDNEFFTIYDAYDSGYNNFLIEKDLTIDNNNGRDYNGCFFNISNGTTITIDYNTTSKFIGCKFVGGGGTIIFTTKDGDETHLDGIMEGCFFENITIKVSVNVEEDYTVYFIAGNYYINCNIYLGEYEHSKKYYIEDGHYVDCYISVYFYSEYNTNKCKFSGCDIHLYTFTSGNKSIVNGAYDKCSVYLDNNSDTDNMKFSYIVFFGGLLTCKDDESGHTIFEYGNRISCSQVNHNSGETTGSGNYIVGNRFVGGNITDNGSNNNIQANVY